MAPDFKGAHLRVGRPPGERIFPSEPPLSPNWITVFKARQGGEGVVNVDQVTAAVAGPENWN